MKKTLLIILSALIVLAILTTTTLYFFDGGKYLKIEKARLQYEFEDINPDWKQYTTDEHIYLDSPYPINWQTKEGTTKDGQNIKIVTGISKMNRSGFVAAVSYENNSDEKTASDQIKVMTEAEKNTFQSLNNSHLSEQAITCSGMPATLIDTSYDFNNETKRRTSLYLAKGDLYLTVIIATNNTNNHFDELSKKMVNSIQIKNP